MNGCGGNSKSAPAMQMTPRTSTQKDRLDTTDDGMDLE